MEIISGCGSTMESVYGDYKWAWFFYRVSMEIISGRGSSIESVCGDYKWAWFRYGECLWRL